MKVLLFLLLPIASSSALNPGCRTVLGSREEAREVTECFPLSEANRCQQRCSVKCRTEERVLSSAVAYEKKCVLQRRNTCDSNGYNRQHCRRCRLEPATEAESVPSGVACDEDDRYESSLKCRPDQVKKCLRYMRDRCDAAGGTCRKVPFVRCTCRRRTCKKTYRTVHKTVMRKTCRDLAGPNCGGGGSVNRGCLSYFVPFCSVVPKDMEKRTPVKVCRKVCEREQNCMSDADVDGGRRVACRKVPKMVTVQVPKLTCG